MLRMKLSDLKYEVFQEIVKLHDNRVGGHGSRCLNFRFFEDNVINYLRWGYFVKLGFGSRITIHSELCIFPDFCSKKDSLIYFRFIPHAINGEDKIGKKLASKLEHALDIFLEKKGIAIAK